MMHYAVGDTVQIPGRVVCLLILAVFTLEDIRHHRISGNLLIFSSVLAGIYGLVVGEDGWLKIGGLLMGILFLGISKFSREGIGYGDSWLFCILGWYLGIWKLLEVLAVTWMLAGIAAMFLLAAGKYRRKISFPLVPFLMAGYLTMWMSEVAL